MYTSDEFGRSRVFVQNLNFLRLILDVPEQQFSVWLKAFENVGNYYFSIYEPDSRVFKLPVSIIICFVFFYQPVCLGKMKNFFLYHFFTIMRIKYEINVL